MSDSLIKKLEEVRNSKVIVYMTGDRKPIPFSSQIGIDILPQFKNVLKKIDNTEKITLALYTNGGHLDVPWPLVNIIREHCKEFEVLIMDRALSAGTMISLGADRIVMGPHAFLSPIDPAANFTDGENKQSERFEVEDIIGYIDFVKEKIGITEQESLTEIMKDLTKEINPTKLGSINRTHSLVRRLSKKLLGLHVNNVSVRDSKEITENLTEKLLSHKHLINRKEAVEIGFGNIIEFSTKKVDKLTEQLLKYYSNYLKIYTDFDASKELGTRETKKEVKISIAVIHTEDIKYEFVTKWAITKTTMPTGELGINANLIGQKWEKI